MTSREKARARIDAELRRSMEPIPGTETARRHAEGAYTTIVYLVGDGSMEFLSDLFDKPFARVASVDDGLVVGFGLVPETREVPHIPAARILLRVWMAATFPLTVEQHLTFVKAAQGAIRERIKERFEAYPALRGLTWYVRRFEAKQFRDAETDTFRHSLLVRLNAAWPDATAEQAVAAAIYEDIELSPELLGPDRDPACA